MIFLGYILVWLPYLKCCDEGYSTEKDRWGVGRGGGRVVSYVREQSQCMELCLGKDENSTENLRGKD